MSTGPATPEGKAVVCEERASGTASAPRPSSSPPRRRADWDDARRSRRFVVRARDPARARPRRSRRRAHLAPAPRLARRARRRHATATSTSPASTQRDSRERAASFERRAWPVMPEEVVLAPILALRGAPQPPAPTRRCTNSKPSAIAAPASPPPSPASKSSAYPPNNRQHTKLPNKRHRRKHQTAEQTPSRKRKTAKQTPVANQGFRHPRVTPNP